MNKLILAALGLSETASEAEVLAAIQALGRTMEDIVELTGIDEPRDAVAQVKVWKNDAATSGTKIQQLSTDLAASKAEAKKQTLTGRVDKLIADKKIAPAERDFAISLGMESDKAFDNYLATRPPLVLPEPRQQLKPQDGGGTVAAGATQGGTVNDTDLSAEELETIEKLGVTPESYVANRKLVKKFPRGIPASLTPLQMKAAGLNDGDIVALNLPVKAAPGARLAAG